MSTTLCPRTIFLHKSDESGIAFTASSMRLQSKMLSLCAIFNHTQTNLYTKMINHCLKKLLTESNDSKAEKDPWKFQSELAFSALLSSSSSKGVPHSLIQKSGPPVAH